jgi:hypothetical protein
MNVSPVAAQTSSEAMALKMSTADHDDFHLLAVLWPLLEDAKGSSMGVPEGKPTKDSGLDVQTAMRHLGRLEREKLVSSQIIQIGTAGPYERYYRLMARVASLEVLFSNKPSNR